MVVFSLLMTSCRVGTVPYFHDLKDSVGGAASVIETRPFEAPRIKPFDRLIVDVHTMEGGGNTALSKEGSVEELGLLVDKDGFIELPILGRIQLAGLTLFSAKEAIREVANKYYVNPAVNVSFATFYVTVLGDVALAGRKTFNTEKVTVLDALGESRDMLVSGRRENILVIREENNHRSYGRLNLNSTDIYKSPYFYMRPGDLVYVEQNFVKAKAATTDYSRDRYIAYTTSFLAILLSTLNLITNLNRD